MTSLVARAEEFMEDTKLVCKNSNSSVSWDKFIVTIKKNEVIAWSFDCLTCEHSSCPINPSMSCNSISKSDYAC